MSEEVKNDMLVEEPEAEPTDQTTETAGEHQPEAKTEAKPGDGSFEIDFGDTQEDAELKLLRGLPPEQREEYLRFKYGQAKQAATPSPPAADPVQKLSAEVEEIKQKLAEAQAAENADEAARLFEQYMDKRDELAVARARAQLAPEIERLKAIASDVPVAVTQAVQFVKASGNTIVDQYMDDFKARVEAMLKREPSLSKNPEALATIAELADAQAFKAHYMKVMRKRGAQPPEAAVSSEGGKVDDEALKKEAKELGFDSVEDYKFYKETGEYRL